MEETMANCSQQFDLALCCVVSRRVFTQLVQTEVRAELLHFHFQPPEMPVVQKKKYGKPGFSSNQSNWCHFQPLPFLQSPVAGLPQTLLLSHNQNAGT